MGGREREKWEGEREMVDELNYIEKARESVCV